MQSLPNKFFLSRFLFFLPHPELIAIPHGGKQLYSGMTIKTRCYPPGMMLLLKVHVILGTGTPIALQVNLSCSPLVKAISPGSSVKAGRT